MFLLLLLLLLLLMLMLPLLLHSASCDFVSDILKLQFAESAVPEALSEMIHDLQGGSDPHDLCSIKIASNLIVSLLLGGGSHFCSFMEECLCVLFGFVSLWLSCRRIHAEVFC